MTRIGAPRIPDWYTALPYGRFSCRSGCGHRNHGPHSLVVDHYTTSSPDDNHISRLRVPPSLVDSVLSPPIGICGTGWHGMIHGTTLMHQSFTMPMTAPGARRVGTASTHIWYMSLWRKAF